MAGVQRCMVEHPIEVWTPGIVMDKSSGWTVKTDTGEEIRVDKDNQIFECSDTSLNPISDLTALEELHSSLILENLKTRYMNDDIYTYIGPMIVSLNPFRNLPNIAGPEKIPDYITEAEGLAPHPYAIGQKAYKSMCNFKESQSVVISGESGAGKTEATKIVLKFLTVASGSGKTAAGHDISQMILATNPILEAFGNAKTTRNNNSSRFGKFIKISFANNSICGARVDNYLLEKTRIVYQAPTERNYHIFYMFVKGATDEERTKYHIRKSPADYTYCTNGDIEVPAINDKEWMDEVREAFTTLAFTDDETDSIYRLLSGILLVGNIEFDGQEKVTVKNDDLLEELVELWGVAKGLLKSSLEAREFSAGRGTAYKVPLSATQAIENRDALAKAIYYNLFDWIVAKLNKSLEGPTKEEYFIGVLDIYGFEIFEINSLEQFCINYANEKLHQQFNEKMFKAEQAEYTKEGIPWTEIDFKDNSHTIDLIDKKPSGIISLLDEEGRVPKGTNEGFLGRLDKQHSRNISYRHLPQDKDAFCIGHFAGTVKYQIANFLEKNKDTLNVDLVKAMKSSPNELIKEIFLSDEEKKAKEDGDKPAETAADGAADGATGARGGLRGGRGGMFERGRGRGGMFERGRGGPMGGPGRGGGPGGGAGGAGGASATADKTTVVTKFKNDLAKLITTLDRSNRHYIRCIKPNDDKAYHHWEAQKVYEQLSCNGVHETVTLRKAGYPNRVPFDRFLARYSPCMEGLPETKEGIEQFLHAFLPGGNTRGEWAVGATKIFFRDLLLTNLQKKLEEMFEGQAMLMQARIRAWHAIRKTEELREKAMNSLVLKRFIRKYHAEVELNRLRREYAEKVRCTNILQNNARRYHAACAYLDLKAQHQASTNMSKFIRRAYAMGDLETLREERRRRIAAANLLENYVRRYQAQCELLTLQEAERIRKEKEEQARLEAERKKREEEERIRREAEEAERKRVEEEEARKRAEEAERQRIAAEKAAAEAAAALERAKQQAKDEEERNRLIREAEEAARAAAEEARLLEEKLRAEEEARKREAEEMKRKKEQERKDQEEAEMRAIAEAERKVREEVEALERAKFAQLEAAEAAKRAKQQAEAAEKARQQADATERERQQQLQAEATEKAKQAQAPLEDEDGQGSPARGGRGGARGARGGRGAGPGPVATPATLPATAEAPAEAKSPARGAARGRGRGAAAVGSGNTMPECEASPRAKQEPVSPAKTEPQTQTSSRPTRPTEPTTTTTQRTRGPSRVESVCQPTEQDSRRRGPSRAPAVVAATPTPTSPRQSASRVRSSIAVPRTQLAQGAAARQRTVSLSGLARVSNISDIVVEMEPEKYEALEQFFLDLGLPLAEQFSEEMIDLDQMLEWEDPRAELIDLGITQRGVITRILKALEAKKAPPPSIFASVFSSAPLPTPSLVLPSNLPGIPLTLAFSRGVLFLDQARSKISLLADTYSIYIRSDIRKGEQRRFKAKAPTVTTPNSVPLRPDWKEGKDKMPNITVKIDDGWDLCLEFMEPGTFKDTLLGCSMIPYRKIVRLGNGEHWIPVKYEDGTSLGQMLISFTGLDEVEPPQPQWQDDPILGPQFEAITCDLVRDYETHPPQARLVRSISSKTSTLAVLYIPTFSDYFWQEEIANSLNEEGYHFYALELRRYSRTLKPRVPQQHPYLVRDLIEYYEEILWALKTLRFNEGINRVILGGHGLGATTALLFAHDHSGEVEGIFLNAPIVGLSPMISGFSKPLGWFSAADSETACVCEPFHASVHVDRHGPFDWDQTLKPIPGFPLHAGLIDALTLAFTRLTGEKSGGISVDVPVLLLSSASHVPVLDPASPLARKCDVLQDVATTVRLAPKWGKRVQINLIKEALHDVFLSDIKARDEAFDSFLDFFSWLEEGSSAEPPSTGGLRGSVIPLSISTAVEDDDGESIFDAVSGIVNTVNVAVAEAQAVGGGALLNLEQEISTFVGSDDEEDGKYNYHSNVDDYN